VRRISGLLLTVTHRYQHCPKPALVLGATVDVMSAGHIVLTVHFLSQFVDVGTMVSPTVFARRSLAYLLSDQAEAALRDAMQAQYVHPEWPTAFYMQAAALSKLGMETDANDMLKEGATLDSRRQNS
jgi:hypothetical protein